jgi:hypothetical protein
MAVHLPDVGPQPLGPATARSGRHQGRYGLLVAPTDIRTVWRSHPVRIFRTSLQRFGPMSLTGTHTALALRNSRRRRRAGVELSGRPQHALSANPQSDYPVSPSTARAPCTFPRSIANTVVRHLPAALNCDAATPPLLHTCGTRGGSEFRSGVDDGHLTV